MPDASVVTNAAILEKYFSELKNYDTTHLPSGWKLLDVDSYSEGNFKAITVRDSDGNIYVHFNGTGDGNWKHNADSAYGNGPSDMQKWASEYLDTTVRKNYGGRGQLYVTGHSQGGNNALYAAMVSKYVNQITNVITLDAPGFNQATLDEAKRLNGEAYYELLKRTYAINGENDYVHLFGENKIIDLIPKDNSFYIVTPGASDFDGYHHINEYFREGDELNYWGKDVERGPIAELVVELMENFMKDLPPEQRHEAAVVLMALVEHFIGNKKPIEDVNLQNIIDALLDLWPVIRKTAIENPGELWNVLTELGVDKMIEAWVKDNPLIVAALVILSPIWVPFALGILGGQIMLYLFDKLTDIVQSIVSSVTKFVLDSLQAIKNAIDGFRKWLNRAGIKYAQENPYLKADTGKLRSYATRINNVNNRLNRLDSDLRSLYWQVGFLDLWDIMVANLLTSGSPTLNQVKLFLEDTANRLESADNTARGNMGG